MREVTRPRRSFTRVTNSFWWFEGNGRTPDYKPLNGTVGDQADVRQRFSGTKSQGWLWLLMRILPRCFGPAGLAFRLSPCVRIRVGFTSMMGTAWSVSIRRLGNWFWQSDPVTRRESFTFNFGPRLVIHEDVVLYSGGDGKMQSRDAKTGGSSLAIEFPLTAVINRLRILW